MPISFQMTRCDFGALLVCLGLQKSSTKTKQKIYMYYTTVRVTLYVNKFYSGKTKHGIRATAMYKQLFKKLKIK